MYDSLNVKCFAYFPCNDEEDKTTNDDDDGDYYHGFWRNANHRRTGSCVNSSKVIVFDSTDDYNSYLMNNLNRDQLSNISKSLYENRDHFMPERKRNAVCRSFFPNFWLRIVENFDRYFQCNESRDNNSDDSHRVTSRTYIRQTINVYPRKNPYSNTNKNTSSQTMMNFFIVLTLFFLLTVALTCAIAFGIKLCCSKKYVEVQLESQE